MCTRPVSDEPVFLTGDAAILEKMASLPPRPVFDPAALAFLESLSAGLLRDPGIRRTPDIMTFAFWCRRASLLEQRRLCADTASRWGRGLALHIAPSNVPILFAYSLAAGLLAGNANVVRVPSAPFPQVDRLCAALTGTLAGSELKDSVVCLRYDRSSAMTAHLSRLCDARLIWGGDETIRAVRGLPPKPRAVDVCFADRYSLCVIRSEAYLAEKDKAAFARRFYTDTYLSDQNACSAPQVVLWLGEAVREARDAFWPALAELVRRDYALPPVRAVAKREAFLCCAALHPGVRLAGNDNGMVRVEVPELFPELMDFRAGSGFFFEMAGTLADLTPLAGEKCQTLTQCGVTPEEFRRFLETVRPKGIDRIVPVGSAMDFSLIWDGYDLIAELSCKKTLLPSGTRA